MQRSVVLGCVLLVLTSAVEAQEPAPVIDVHQHAIPADFWNWASPDRASNPDWFDDLPVQAAETDQALIEATLEAMDRYNIVQAIFSGPQAWVERWRQAAPGRVLRGSNFAGPCTESRIQTLRELHEEDGYEVMGEISWPFAGISLDDPRVDACFALAEELDIPMGIHMGLGFPGAHRFGYRASASRPLLLEGPLAEHPDLRLYIMHAGWPFIDETIALMQVHPSVYADLSVINWFIPEKAFHAALKRLMDAGLGERLMYGSDAGVWPGAIALSLERMGSADFLSEEERRDILYWNAVKFFRLKQGQN